MSRKIPKKISGNAPVVEMADKTVVNPLVPTLGTRIFHRVLTESHSNDILGVQTA